MRYIYKIHPSIIEDSHVTAARATVGQVAEWKPEYNLIINGDGWYGSQSASLWYSEGVRKNGTQLHWRPWINFDKNNKYKFGWIWGTHLPNFNCVSGTRFVVERGELNSHYKKWPPELNARTAIGITDKGELVILVQDGHDLPYQEGLSLQGLGEAMLEQGCITAMDLDGGGSTTLAINGKVINAPNDDGILGQRSVINALCLRLSQIPGSQPPPEPPQQPPHADEFITPSGALPIHYDGGVLVNEDEIQWNKQ